MEAKNRNIPFIVYEAMLERQDRQQRRLLAVIMVVISLLVASNGIWIYHQIRCSCQPNPPQEEEEEEIEEIDRERDGESAGIFK